MNCIQEVLNVVYRSTRSNKIERIPPGYLMARLHLLHRKRARATLTPFIQCKRRDQHKTRRDNQLSHLTPKAPASFSAVVSMENQVGAADTALAATQARVPLLHHLPVAKVRLAAFDDHKSERPNKMPFRMFFGTIKDGKDKDCEVLILLQNDHPDGRSPDQRFNIFDRLNKLRGAMSAEEAVKLVIPAV